MRSICLVILAGLAGCAMPTHSQQQHETGARAMSTAHESYRACADNVDMQFPDALARKILITGHDDPQTIVKLSLDRNVTEAEKESIIEYRSAMSSCRSIHINALGQISGAHVQAFSNVTSRNDLIISELVTGSTTIAEANRQIIASANQFGSEMNHVNNQWSSALQQQHNAEVQQRQQAWQAFRENQIRRQEAQNAQNALNQQLLRSNTPRRTTCQNIGGRTECTHY